MPVAKSQKGRLTAAPQTEEIARYSSGVSHRRRTSRQQFGSPGTAHRGDRDADTLSRRTKRVIGGRVARRKGGGGV